MTTMAAPNNGQLFPIRDERDVVTERVPSYLEFEPAAQVAAGATGQVDEIIAWRDYVVTHIGFNCQLVGFPAVAMPFKVSIQDIGAQRNWQPHRFDIQAIIGNVNVAAQEIPVPWIFKEKTTIRVVFENVGGLPCLPRLVLGGYLDISPAIIG